MNIKEKIITVPSTIPEEIITNKIYIIRGKKVMLDADLAELYGVQTRRLNEQVKRNLDRFPDDFMFQLTNEEMTTLDRSQFATGSRKSLISSAPLKSQFATSNIGRGGRRKLSYAFTEHGVAMLSAILKSERAVTMSIFIVRAFIKMRELLATNKEFAQKIDEIERKQNGHSNQLSTISSVLKQLVARPKPVRKERLLKRTKIGYKTTE